MRRRITPGLLPILGTAPVLVWLFLIAGCGTSGDDLPKTVEFNRHIRPILSDKCFTCHGPDPGTREADLRLDIREAALAEREGYDAPAIVPGRPGKSALVARIHHEDPSERMPPPDTRAQLTDRERALLERWIDQGAEYQPHWSYILPKKETPPDVEEPGHNAIDRFIRAALEREGLTPSREADRNTLIRRLYIDLLGLSAPAGEVAAFVEDTRPDAYEHVVDRLLQSQHYGERMALMWLDLVRYADTDGYHSDLHRNISPYRDYVIDAFNSNKPFDQFTREQIAGDLLPHATVEQLVASGFNRLGQATKEGGAQMKEYLVKYAGDRVRAVGTAWMGATIGCAECHDHKFDPFTQADFYRMAAFFADVKEKGVFLNRNWLPPEMPLPDREEAAALEKLRAEQSRRSRRGNGPRTTEDALQEQLALGIPHTLVTQAVEPRVVRVLRRGNWQDVGGPIVEAGVPEFMPDLPVRGRRVTRLDLADWLVSRENSLTARVFVNHLWARFFGRGLSKVRDDLGSQGEWPTHPELLDWLAVEFMDSGWDVKHMVRLIVTSATYRQTSKPTSDQREEDPENTFLSRQSRFRMPAEIVRDYILEASGLLSPHIGGPSVKPYQPEGYWSEIQTFGTGGPASEWTASEGADQYRRGLYTYWKRSFLHPAMMAFDAPDRQECAATRARSNTPLQALVLLNDPSYVEAARVFSAAMLKEGGKSFEQRLDWGFVRVLARRPEPAEIEELRRLYGKEKAWYAANPESAFELIRTGQAPHAEGLDLAEHAAMTTVARAIFNMHETITRY